MELLDYAASRELIGQKVTDTLGHGYGKVKDILFSKKQGRALAVVIDAGGSFSKDYIVLPFQSIRVNPNTRQIMHEIDKETLQGAPIVDLQKLRDGEEEEFIRLYNYYGFEKLWKEPDQEAPPVHESYHSGDDVGEKHPSAEGSYQITQQYPGPKGSNTEEEVDYDKMKGLPKEKKK